MPGYELIGKEERKEVNKVFLEGGILFRQGFEKLRKSYKVLEFEKKFAKYMNTKYALAVTSGTAALRVALAALNLKDGDEVITQSFTFVATVEAIVEARLKPVCCDVDKTLNMSPQKLKKLINKKTKAIIVVHMLGVSPHMREIIKICKKRKIIIIEDTAWGCGGYYNNKHLGTLGRIGTFSFDFAKSITTGEGGMVVFKKEKDFLTAKAWHDHGHENNPRVPRWEDTRKNSGFNFRMNELQACVGLAQLKKLKKILLYHKKNYNLIFNKIKNLGLNFREIPRNNVQTFESLIFFAKDKKQAKKFRKSLLENGISTKILPEASTWHFCKFWSHIKELNKRHKKLNNNFKESDIFLSRAVSIPINIKMNKETPEKIFKSLKKVLAN